MDTPTATPDACAFCGAPRCDGRTCPEEREAVARLILAAAAVLRAEAAPAPADVSDTPARPAVRPAA